MKAWWNSFKISFSMYSKIPMPQSDWTGENMRYVMCFFPLIGVPIGVLVCLWWLLAQFLGMTEGNLQLFTTAVMVVIPVAISGGIHLDGFLDTSDALSSRQPLDKRLEILKDSHAGAFAIIMGCGYFVLLFGTYGAFDMRRDGLLFALTFVLSRAYSGLAVVSFRLARNSGLVSTFSDNAQKRTVRIWMIVYLVIVMAVMILWAPVHGTIACVTALLVFLYYRHMAYRNFGGITGDLAGWFLQVCELAVPLVLVVAQQLI